MDVVAVELAGRGARMDEAIPQDDAADAVEMGALVSAIRHDISGVPFMVCGLSMGALLAIEATVRLCSDSQASMHPFALVLAGRVPPTHVAEGGVAGIDTYILASTEARQSAAWQTVFLPMLEADLEADSRSAARVLPMMSDDTASANLPLAIDVHCAFADASFPWQAARDYARLLPAARASELEVHYYPGGHDFLTASSGEIFRKVSTRARLMASIVRPIVAAPSTIGHTCNSVRMPHAHLHARASAHCLSAASQMCLCGRARAVHCTQCAGCHQLSRRTPPAWPAPSCCRSARPMSHSAQSTWWRWLRGGWSSTSL